MYFAHLMMIEYQGKTGEYLQVNIPANCPTDLCCPSDWQRTFSLKSAGLLCAAASQS